MANTLDKHRQKCAELVTQEVGKPIGQSLGEITKTIGHCKYYAEHLEEYTKDTIVKTDAKKSYISY